MSDSTSTVTILGLTTGPIFGVPDMTGVGVGQSLEKTLVAGTATVLKNGNGVPVAAAIQDTDEHEVSYTVGITGSWSVPAAGTSIAIDGENFFFKSAKMTKKQGDFAEYQITATKWSNITPSSSAT